MPLVNIESSPDLTLFANYVVCQTNRLATFGITDMKLYDVPIVVLSTHDSAKLLQQLKSEYKWTIN